jgi:hypothetical protein
LRAILAIFLKGAPVVASHSRMLLSVLATEAAFGQRGGGLLFKQRQAAGHLPDSSVVAGRRGYGSGDQLLGDAAAATRRVRRLQPGPYPFNDTRHFQPRITRPWGRDRRRPREESGLSTGAAPAATHASITTGSTTFAGVAELLSRS